MSLHRDRLGELIRERDTLAARLRAADEEIREARAEIARLRAEVAVCRVRAEKAAGTAYRIDDGSDGTHGPPWRHAGRGDAS